VKRTLCLLAALVLLAAPAALATEQEEGADRKATKAEGSANAVAGTAGANKQAEFTNGMAVYQLTEGGLMLQADISGTKYWKNKKLDE